MGGGGCSSSEHAGRGFRTSQDGPRAPPARRRYCDWRRLNRNEAGAGHLYCHQRQTRHRSISIRTAEGGKDGPSTSHVCGARTPCSPPPSSRAGLHQSHVVTVTAWLPRLGPKHPFSAVGTSCNVCPRGASPWGSRCAVQGRGGGGRCGGQVRAARRPTASTSSITGAALDITCCLGF